MAIGRLQAALGAVSNEVTMAAAQINFDFSIIRREAPKEYLDLGENLSEQRRHEAETGKIHQTARRLGALFQGVCPAVPNLVKAYGTRVSEISRAFKSEAAVEVDIPAFAEYLGVDARSIWAAATSSTAAIQVQLLTCLIAKMFDAPESISIWVELVKGRKQEITTKFETEEEIQFSTLAAAANLDFSRSEFAEWDSSARAWLEIADSNKSKQQKQLMLILDNLELAVDDRSNVYASVIAAWKASMTTMEELIQGVPQAVEDGAALLGLASWHIYPDMVVLGSESPNLTMSDSLVAPGGTLTLGIQYPLESKASRNRNGIYWSLSLAHLRFYGEPVLAARKLNSSNSKITWDQLGAAVLACLFEQWHIRESSVSDALEFLVALSGALISASRGIRATNAAADEATSTSDDESVKSSDDETTCSSNDEFTGTRHGGFIPTADDSTGDSDAEFFTNVNNESPGTGDGGFFTTVDVEPSDIDGDKTVTTDDADFPAVPQWFAWLSDTAKRLLDSTGEEHDEALKLFRLGQRRFTRFTSIDSAGERLIPFDLSIFGARELYFGLHEPELLMSLLDPQDQIDFLRFVAEAYLPASSTDVLIRLRVNQYGMTNQYLVVPASKNSNLVAESESYMTVDELILWTNSYLGDFDHDDKFFVRSLSGGDIGTYNVVFGNPLSAAIFVSSGVSTANVNFSMEDLTTYFHQKSESISRKSLEQLCKAMFEDTPAWLCCLEIAATVHRHLPGRTVDITILDHPITQASFVQGLQKRDRKEIRGIALSCITYFENPKNNLDPSRLKDVFAMSTGNSLYISNQVSRPRLDVS